MKGFLSIGKVSKLKHVSIKSLRYYDELGILTPALVDQETNYRYYTEDQLFVLDAISLCVELGIPLKDFHKYQDSKGALDLQRLLFDGKSMAEEKILNMRTCLEKLQNTLLVFENEKKSQAKTDFYVRELPERHILTAPFDSDTHSSSYGRMLLTLFVTAEKLGLKATYPSGLLYHFSPEGIEKYVFVHITASTLQNKHIMTLPGGNYLCQNSPDSHIEHAAKLYRTTVTETDSFWIIETNRIEKQSGQNKTLLELQKLI